MAGDRLKVTLRYSDGGADPFDWQVFTPEQLVFQRLW